jgi:hypothetical protein
MKSLIVLLILTQSAWAGLPPTTSKISGDANPVTTFNFNLPAFTGTHSGPSLTIPTTTNATFNGLNLGGLSINQPVVSDGSKNLASGSVSSPLTFAAGAFGCQTASGSQAGCLASADWTTFNNKGSGSVTSTSVVTANGFAGTVATATTTPAITIKTTVNGILLGNSTSVSAAVAGTDYQAPITLTTTGSSGAATFIGNTLNIPQYSGGGAFTVTWITKTANYTVLSSDSGIICGTATSAPFTLTMPAASTVSGHLYFITNNSSYAVTLTPNGSDSIFNGGPSTSQTLSTGASVILVSDGSTNYNAF